MSVFSVVKDNVTARQVAERCGMKVNRIGMVRCPFHGEKTPSMKVDQRYYCFGCGETGDAIDLVAKTQGIAPKEAAEQIAEAFGLRVGGTKRSPAKRIIPMRLERFIQEEKEKRCFRVLSDYYHLLKQWEIIYAPKRPGEEWNLYYEEALRNIDKVEYQLDTLLTKDCSDRAFVVSEVEKEVEELERRITEHRKCKSVLGSVAKRKSCEQCW